MAPPNSSSTKMITRVEDLPEYKNKKTPRYNPFNFERGAPKENEFGSDREVYQKDPAIFSTRGTLFPKRRSPKPLRLNEIQGSAPIGEHSNAVKVIAARFRKDFPLDCKGVTDFSWKRLPYYFDDHDVYAWGVEFLERVLLHIFQENTQLHNRLLRFAVHLVATDSPRARELACWGKAVWYYEEVAHYGGDFLEEMVKFMTYRSDVYPKLQALAAKYLEEARGDSHMKPMWYDVEFAELTMARTKRQSDPLQASCMLKQEVDVPLAPSYPHSAKKHGSQPFIVPQLALEIEINTEGDLKTPQTAIRSFHHRRTSSFSGEVSPSAFYSFQGRIEEQAIPAGINTQATIYVSSPRQVKGMDGGSSTKDATKTRPTSSTSETRKRVTPKNVQASTAERNIERLGDDQKEVEANPEAKVKDIKTIDASKPATVAQIAQPDLAELGDSQKLKANGNANYQSINEGKKPISSSQNQSGQKIQRNHYQSSQDVRSLSQGDKRTEHKEVDEKKKRSVSEEKLSSNSNNGSNESSEHRRGNIQHEKQRTGGQGDYPHHKKKKNQKRNKQDLRIDTHITRRPSSTVRKESYQERASSNQSVLNDDGIIISVVIVGKETSSPGLKKGLTEAPNRVQPFHKARGTDRSSAQDVRNFKQYNLSGQNEDGEENDPSNFQERAVVQRSASQPPYVTQYQSAHGPMYPMPHYYQHPFQETAHFRGPYGQPLPLVPHPMMQNFHQGVDPRTQGMQPMQTHLQQSHVLSNQRSGSSGSDDRENDQEQRSYSNYNSRGRGGYRGRYPSDMRGAFRRGNYQGRRGRYNSLYRSAPRFDEQAPQGFVMPSFPQYPIHDEQFLHQPYGGHPYGIFFPQEQPQQLGIQDFSTDINTNPAMMQGMITVMNGIDERHVVAHRRGTVSTMDETDDACTVVHRSNSPIRTISDSSIAASSDNNNAETTVPAFIYPMVYPRQPTPQEVAASNRSADSELCQPDGTRLSTYQIESDEDTPTQATITSRKEGEGQEDDQETPKAFPTTRKNSQSSPEAVKALKNTAEMNESNTRVSGSNNKLAMECVPVEEILEEKVKIPPGNSPVQLDGDKTMNQKQQISSQASAEVNPAKVRSAGSDTTDSSKSHLTWAQKASGKAPQGNASSKPDKTINTNARLSDASASPPKDTQSNRRSVSSSHRAVLNQTKFPQRHYYPSREVGQEFEDPFKLYVAGINLTDAALVKIFEPYRPTSIGSTRPCKADGDPRRPHPPDGMMYTFVTFESVEACKKARHALAGTIQDGMYLKVNTAFDRQGRDRVTEPRLTIPLPWVTQTMQNKDKDGEVSVPSQKKSFPINSLPESKSFWTHVKKQEKISTVNKPPLANKSPPSEKTSKGGKSSVLVSDFQGHSCAKSELSKSKAAEIPRDSKTSSISNSGESSKHVPIPSSSGTVLPTTVQQKDNGNTSSDNAAFKEGHSKAAGTDYRSIQSTGHPPIFSRMKKDKKKQEQKIMSPQKSPVARKSVDEKTIPTPKTPGSYSYTQQDLSQATTAAGSPERRPGHASSRSSTTATRESSPSKIGRAFEGLRTWGTSLFNSKSTRQDDRPSCALVGSEISNGEYRGDAGAGDVNEELVPYQKTSEQTKRKKKKAANKNKKDAKFSSTERDSRNAETRTTSDVSKDCDIADVSCNRNEKHGDNVQHAVEGHRPLNASQESAAGNSSDHITAQFKEDFPPLVSSPSATAHNDRSREQAASNWKDSRSSTTVQNRQTEGWEASVKLNSPGNSQKGRHKKRNRDGSSPEPTLLVNIMEETAEGGMVVDDGEEHGPSNKAMLRLGDDKQSE